MSKTIKAVTVTKDYLNRKIWVVKLLSVFDRKDGTPYWFVTKIIDSDPDQDLMYGRAVDYAVKNTLAYVHGVKHGNNLTEQQKTIMRMYNRIKK